MNDESHLTVEQRLEAATRWESPAPNLWEKALPTQHRHFRQLQIPAVLRRPPSALAACLAIALGGLLIVALIVPTLGRARSSPKMARQTQQFGLSSPAPASSDADGRSFRAGKPEAASVAALEKRPDASPLQTLP